MNLYEELEFIALKHATKGEVFQSHQADLTFQDHFVLTELAVAGDQYVWWLKGNGCGTQLRLLGSDLSAKQVEDLASEPTALSKSIFYHLVCDGPNSGSVKKITYDKLKQLVIAVKPNTQRVPRLKTLSDQFDRIITKVFNSGLTRPLQDILGQSYDENGEIKKTIKDNIALLHIHVRKGDAFGTLVNPTTGVVAQSSIYVGPDIDQFTPADHYYLVDANRFGYGKLSTSTKKAFDKAISKATDLREKISATSDSAFSL
jgi:hypothetical protein